MGHINGRYFFLVYSICKRPCLSALKTLLLKTDLSKYFSTIRNRTRFIWTMTMVWHFLSYKEESNIKILIESMGLICMLQWVQAKHDIAYDCHMRCIQPKSFDSSTAISLLNYGDYWYSRKTPLIQVQP